MHPLGRETMREHLTTSGAGVSSGDPFEFGTHEHLHAFVVTD